LKSLGAQNHDFAELFVFNGLTPFLFRAFREWLFPVQKGPEPAIRRWAQGGWAWDLGFGAMNHHTRWFL
jgi:hypothetical protein